MDDDSRGLIVDLLFEIARIERPGFASVIHFHHGHALMPRVGGEHLAILRMHGAGHQNAVTAGQSHGHHGRFRNGGRAVVHGRIGNFHAGELAEHGLKFEDGGQGALRDFGLIGSVGGQEFGARNHRVHQHRPVMAIDARAQERRVAVGALSAARAKVIDNLVLGFSSRDIERAVETDFGGKVSEQAVQRIDAQHLKHLAALDIGLR